MLGLRRGRPSFFLVMLFVAAHPDLAMLFDPYTEFNS
jgi:hypothetical protein